MLNFLHIISFVSLIILSILMLLPKTKGKVMNKNGFIAFALSFIVFMACLIVGIRVTNNKVQEINSYIQNITNE